MKHMENSTRRHILVSNVRAYGRFLFGGMMKYSIRRHM